MKLLLVLTMLFAANPAYVQEQQAEQQATDTATV